jgi:putative MATE family efflux protein
MKFELTKGSLLKQIFSMSFSMGIGMLSVIGFNLADTYFISQIGDTELAAISLTFPVIMFFFGITFGTTTAVTTLVSRAIGERNNGLARRYTTDSLSFALVISVISIGFGLIFMKPLFYALGANENTYPIILEYMAIWFPGMVFLTVPMTGNAAIRARGDMFTAATIMVVAAIVNIILDPILIFGVGFIPPLGVEGAALATVIARGITFVVAIYYLHFKYHLLDLSIPKLNDILGSWKKISSIAFPVAATNFLPPLSVAFATGIIARMGEQYIAAYGIISRIEGMALVVVFSVSSAIGPIIGQNYGAKENERIKLSILYSFGIVFIWGGVVSIFLYFYSETIMSAFTKDPKIIEIGKSYFYLVPLSYGLFGIRIITSTIFNTLDATIKSTFLAIINLLLIFMPLVYLGSLWKGIDGVFSAHFITNIVIGIISLFYIKYWLNKKLGKNFE